MGMGVGAMNAGFTGAGYPTDAPLNLVPGAGSAQWGAPPMQVMPMPDWQQQIDAYGQTYYLDRNTGRTSYSYPPS
jgi:hypothetical protein